MLPDVVSDTFLALSMARTALLPLTNCPLSQYVCPRLELLRLLRAFVGVLAPGCSKCFFCRVTRLNLKLVWFGV